MVVFYHIFVLLLAAVQHECTEQKNYDGWSIIKAKPQNNDQLAYLNSLGESDLELQIWLKGKIGKPFDIFVSPQSKEQVISKLDELGITYQITTENVQRALLAERRTSRIRSGFTFPNAEWFDKFLTLDQINSAIERLAYEYPKIVTVESIGTTHEERPITLVKISSGGNRQKPAIWIDGGIHAREWIAPATVLFILNQLVTGYSKDRTYVDGANWYIVPVLNPDGYVYTHTKDRMWRKNRRPKECVANSHNYWHWLQQQPHCGCEGVDLNRNFDYDFGGEGTSDNTCHETYRGPHSFSEPESQAVRDFIINHKDIQAYITLHSYSEMWFYPYGNRYNSPAKNAKELKKLAEAGARALHSKYGTTYEVGTAADLLYPSAGGSDDWAKGEAKVRYVYCLELRPRDDYPGQGFILKPRQIIPTVVETYAGLRVVFDEVISSASK